MNSNLDLENKLLTVHVSGDLISTNAEKLRIGICELLKASEGAPQKWNTFQLDLTGAKMIDSVGLNVIVAVLKRVRQRAAKMQITYSDPNVFRTFTFTRLDKHLELVKV